MDRHEPGTLDMVLTGDGVFADLMRDGIHSAVGQAANLVAADGAGKLAASI